MIIGIGTDIVQIPRIERILKLYGDRFKKKILNDIELKKMLGIDISQHAMFLAKRFAAKEAVSKAIGSGIGEVIGFKDIIIMNDELGKPFVRIKKLVDLVNTDNNITDVKSLDNVVVPVEFVYKEGLGTTESKLKRKEDGVSKFKSIDYSRFKIDISISDDYPIAIAFIVISS